MMMVGREFPCHGGICNTEFITCSTKIVKKTEQASIAAIWAGYVIGGNSSHNEDLTYFFLSLVLCQT